MSYGTSNGTSKNGVSKAYAHYPTVAKVTNLGPDIEFPGWGERQTSPIIQVDRPSDWWHGPWIPDMTRGAHPYREQPNATGPLAQMPWHKPGMSGCGCSLSGAAEDSAKDVVTIAAVLGAVYLLYQLARK